MDKVITVTTNGDQIEHRKEKAWTGKTAKTKVMRIENSKESKPLKITLRTSRQLPIRWSDDSKH